MSKFVQQAFESEAIELDLDQITLLKKLSKSNIESRKFQQIISSIKELGIIEPLVVSRQSPQSDRYMLLDGHMRLEALKKMGEVKTVCLISKDDEAFTYNKYISRKAPIQEHKMIQRMVENGVSEKKIAKTLNINVKSIIQKRSLLDGICPEVVELLKDKMLAGASFRYLKKMKAARQIECAMLMIDINDFTARYAQALLESSHISQLVEPPKPKVRRGLSPEKRARMQDEMSKLECEYKLIKDKRGKKNLTLQFTKNYLARLLDNVCIAKFLDQHHPDILEEFQKIANMQSISINKKLE
jgi:ParB/RepB/Spo0J family partition protein